MTRFTHYGGCGRFGNKLSNSTHGANNPLVGPPDGKFSFNISTAGVITAAA